MTGRTRFGVIGAALWVAAGCDDAGAESPGDADVVDAVDAPVEAGDATGETETEAGEAFDVPISCTATLGTGSLTGSVQGEPLGATHAGAVQFSVLGMTGYMVAFAAGGGTCAEGAALMSSAPLALQLCNVAPGDHAVGERCMPDGGGMSISASIKLHRGGDDVSADSGTITILEFDAACGGRVRGSFTADFAGDAVTGAFDTVGCGAVAL